MAYLVLFTHDDPDVRRAVEKVIVGADHRILLAVDGDDAIQKFIENQESIFLVITGVKIPGKNGFEVSEAIRALDESVPIVAYSSLLPEELEEEFEKTSGDFDNCFTAYLQKPAEAELLLEVVSNYVV